MLIRDRLVPVLVLAISLPAVAVAQPPGPRVRSLSLSPLHAGRDLSTYLRELARERPPATKECTSNAVAVSRKSRSGTKGSPDASWKHSAVVWGHVRSTLGDPIAGARVTGEVVGGGALTTIDGSYRVVVPAESLRSPMQVTATVIAIGYATRELTFRVKRRDSVAVDFALCESPFTLAKTAGSEPSASR